jgi:hypothetical protein
LRCEYALKANRRYREALFGMLQELYGSVNPVIQRRTIAVVESLLCSGIGGAWLYLQTQSHVGTRYRSGNIRTIADIIATSWLRESFAAKNRNVP